MDSADLLEHEARLHAVASRLVGPSEAEDVVQETFLRALAVQPDTSRPIAPWLVRVARNLALDVLRRRARFEEVGELEVEAPEPGPIALGELLPALGGLTDGELVVLLLREVLDLTVEEVAAAISTSEASVRVLHSRARGKARSAEARLEEAPRAVSRFLAWLLARQVAGLPVPIEPIDGVGPKDPAWTAGVLAVHATLLDAMVAVSASAGRPDLELSARLLRADAHTALGERIAAAGAYAAAIALAERTERPLERAYGRYRRAGAMSSLGRRAEARAEAERGLAELEGDDSERARRYRVGLRSVLVRVATEEGRADEVAALVAAMGAEADPGVREQILTLVARGHEALDAERWDDAERLFLDAIERLRSLGHPRNEAACLSNLGMCAQGRGDPDASAAWLEAARALAAQVGDRQQVALVDSNLAVTAQLAGRRDEAAVRWLRVIAEWSALGSRELEGSARSHAAVLDQVEGRLERAEAGFAAALALLGAGSVAARAVAGAHLAAVRAELGREPGEPVAMPAGPPGLRLAVALLASGDPALLTEAEQAASVPARLAAQAVRAALARRPARD